jgi:uncharacterized membrane protein
VNRNFIGWIVFGIGVIFLVGAVVLTYLQIIIAPKPALYGNLALANTIVGVVLLFVSSITTDAGRRAW